MSSSFAPALSDATPAFAGPQPRAAMLCTPAPTVTASQSNLDALALFDHHRDLASLAVLDEGRPIGLINRHLFLLQMSKPYHREIYDRKSCIAFMDKEPLMVDADTPIGEMAQRAVQLGEKTLVDGYIVTQDGHFLGLGDGITLMRAVADQQAAQYRQVQQSVEYASVLQRAMLRAARAGLADARVSASVWSEPRDTVGGDFHHMAADEHGWFAGLFDCTGHGVPGAFMTILSASLLARALEQHGPRQPGLLLGALNTGIQQALDQRDPADASRPPPDGTHHSNDGLDGVLLYYTHDTGTLYTASAQTPLYVLSPDAEHVQRIAGSRMGAGYVSTPAHYTWQSRALSLPSGTLIVATTDGYTDQIGGPRGIALGRRRLAESLLAWRDASTDEIASHLRTRLHDWQGQHHRRDDVAALVLRTP